MVLHNNTNVNYQMVCIYFQTHSQTFMVFVAKKRESGTRKIENALNKQNRCLHSFSCIHKWRIRKSILHLVEVCSMCFNETSVERWANSVNNFFLKQNECCVIFLCHQLMSVGSNTIQLLPLSKFRFPNVRLKNHWNAIAFETFCASENRQRQ